MISKPMKTLELHYPMIQFLIMKFIIQMFLNRFSGDIGTPRYEKTRRIVKLVTYIDRLQPYFIFKPP